MSKEELRDAVKKIQLEMLIRLHEVCEKRGLRYYLAFGTCLGAVRHKGFIPWDHDIDVLMPIDDAEELMRHQQDFDPDLFLQCKETDPQYGSIAFKVRNSRTAYVFDMHRNCNYNQGISIDIYPFYIAPDAKVKLKLNIIRSHILRFLTIEDTPMRHEGIYRVARSVLLGLYRGEHRIRKRRSLLEKLKSEKDGKMILDYYGEDVSLFNAITYPREWFAEPSQLEFEGRVFHGPTEPEKYLERRYGDFMALPPVEKRVSEIDFPGVIVDPYKSYREYLTLS